MSIGKTVSIKILDINILTDDFVKIIEKINKENKFNLKENILDYAWGYQDDDISLRINFYRSKRKVEFVSIYDDNSELNNYIKMISTFLKYAELDFKAISLSFGNVYIDIPNVNYKFILPEFKEENVLKYKLSTDIHNIENGDIYLSTNFHFYDFSSTGKKPKDTIINDILGNFGLYYELFKKMTGND